MGTIKPHMMRRIATDEGSVIYAYENISIEYMNWGSHFKALQHPNGFAGAHETHELTVFARPGHRNYIAYKGDYNGKNLPTWWVAV